MSKKITTHIFEQFTKLNVVIVGDVMIDRYLHGKVNRISPEAPVPVVELQSTEDRLGGAANVALNIKAMGATPYLFSAIGSDTEGGDFLRLMNENDLSTHGLLQIEERPTTVKTRIMAGTQQMLRLDREVTTDLVESDRAVFIQRLRMFLAQTKVDVLIFQDYDKGVLSASTIHQIMAETRQRKIPTAVDPKKNNFLAYQLVDLFKPNLKEIRDAVDFEVKPELQSLDNAAGFLHSRLGNRFTMITLSEKGLYLGSDTEGGYIYPTQPRRISDVSGAGDTVISVASLCLAAQTDNRTLAILSNLAGSQVCEIAGVVPVDREQLQKEFLTLQII
ncbi:MAG: bifunctional ADP-heptose synthase [Saprospiraceae bacterium]|nr:bifunctional ADP-heptose synthase [Saprospiraceae bacterium]